MTFLFAELIISLAVIGFGFSLGDIGSVEVRRRSLHEIPCATLYGTARLTLRIKDDSEELVQLFSSKAKKLPLTLLELFNTATEEEFGEMGLELFRPIVVMNA